MAVQTAIAFTTTFLENNHVLTFYELFCDLANYFCTFYGWCTYLNSAISVKKKYLVEFNCFAFFRISDVVNEQVLACFGFELLSLNFYNCVHLINCKSSYTIRRLRTTLRGT